jgi:pimeloyl-ACP methyl ester carboxylesterase
MRLVDLGDATIAVHEWGDPEAPTVLFWHALGLDASGRTIEAVAPRLAEAGFRVVALDGPGFGASPLLPSERYRLEALAQLAHRLVATLDLEPLVFMGSFVGRRSRGPLRGRASVARACRGAAGQRSHRLPRSARR